MCILKFMLRGSFNDEELVTMRQTVSKEKGQQQPERAACWPFNIMQLICVAAILNETNQE